MEWKKHFQAWFQFTRKERLGIYILSVLMICMWVLPSFFQDDSKDVPPLNFSSVQIDSLEKILIERKSIIYGNYNKKDEHLKEDVSYPLKKSASQIPMLDINLADSASLEKLPGIGEKLSARIVKYREKLGGFIDVKQLKEIYGLSDTNYLRFKDFVYVEKHFVPIQIKINHSDYNGLRRHPYIHNLFAKSVLAFLKVHDKIVGPDELYGIGSLQKEEVVKVLPYLDFSY